ncbi:hypothetical protein [Ethanoligenens harbinense]|uniref:hypothetical protein n=1 Tax=Ethanoligenens harbinense TaxID=253239 RepID=UPI0010C12D2B|nr:hypothetical protein [Ethanoligenens harbinense]
MDPHAVVAERQISELRRVLCDGVRRNRAGFVRVEKLQTLEADQRFQFRDFVFGKIQRQNILRVRKTGKIRDAFAAQYGLSGKVSHVIACERTGTGGVSSRNTVECSAKITGGFFSAGAVHIWNIFPVT